MGTKLNPGKWNCYAKADPDEPIFTLRAKDPSGPYFVRMWAFIRTGNFGGAQRELQQMAADKEIISRVGSCEKFDEAFECAADMRAWRKELALKG